MGVRARGSTGCTTSSSSSTLPVVRFEFERSRLTELPVCVRCIFKLDEAMLPRCRTEAWRIVSYSSAPTSTLNILPAADATCRR